MITNRPVGLWMLPPHVAASRGTLAALQREFARLRALDHPHIARLLELGSNGQQYYVTGERLDGESLRDVLTHLSPERLDVGEADDIVRAVGSALVYAHENGVSHGDVRAENVVVTMDRRCVLTNFLSRRISKTTARAPRPRDDLRGLARLAAELYTGSTSPLALRTAVHGDVPAARLNAVREVLDASGRRVGSVADFLAAARLAHTAGGTALRREERLARSWSLWRLVLPVATAVAIGTLMASYHGGWRASADELKDLGLDALRTVAARVAPGPAPSEAPPPLDTAASRADSAEVPAAASAASGHTDPAELAEPAESPPAPALVPEPEAEPPAPRESALVSFAGRPVVALAQREPAAVSFDAARVAVREDHSMVSIAVVRSGDLRGELSASWWIMEGTAREDDDYVSEGMQTLTFAPGVTVQRALIPLVNDGVREPDESFTIHLGRPRGGVTGPVATARVTIYDDD